MAYVTSRAQVTPVSTNNFGFLIAYLIPGFVVVAVASGHSETVRAWLGADSIASPTIGGFLYITLASVAAGMTVSALRWLVLDTLHHHTGIPRPKWDLADLPGKLSGFETLVEYHYRYYQFYGNMLVGMAVLTFMPRALLLLLPADPRIVGGIMAALMVLFYVASRDALAKYYSRTSLVLGIGNAKEKINDQRLSPRTKRFQAGIKGPADREGKPIGAEERHEWWQ